MWFVALLSLGKWKCKNEREMWVKKSLRELKRLREWNELKEGGGKGLKPFLNPKRSIWSFEIGQSQPLIGNGRKPIVTNRYRSVAIRFRSLPTSTDSYRPIQGHVTVSSGRGWSAYQYPVGPVHTARTKPYRSARQTLALIYCFNGS